MPGERDHGLPRNYVAGIPYGTHARAHARVMSQSPLPELLPTYFLHVARIQKGIPGNPLLIVLTIEPTKGHLVLQAGETALHAIAVLIALPPALARPLLNLAREQAKHLPLSHGIVKGLNGLVDDMNERLDGRPDHKGGCLLVPGTGRQNDVGIKRRGIPAPVDRHQKAELG